MAGGTNFEGTDHAKLKAMVANSDPGKVLDRAGKLSKAGGILEELGKALSSHLGRIEWEGPAAESFKAWATNLNKSAVAIGEYSKNVGDTMHQAGSVLSSVKAGVPAVPTADIQAVEKHSKQSPLVKGAGGVAGFVFGFSGGEKAADVVANTVNSDWVSDAEAAAAKKRVYLAHQEAIQQLEKLGQAYTAATTKLNSLQAPTLPGTPGGGSREEAENVPVGSGSGGPSGSGGSVRRPQAIPDGPSAYTPPKYDGGGDGNGTTPPRPKTPLPLPGDPEQKYPPPFHNVPSTPTPGPDDPGAVTRPPSGPGVPPGTDLNSLPPTPTAPQQTGPGGNNQQFPTGPSPYGPTGPNGSGPQVPTGPGPFGPNYTPPSYGGGNTQPKNDRTSGPNQNRPTNGVFGAKEAQNGQGGRNMGTPMGGGGMGGNHMGGGGATGSRGRGLTSTGGGVVGGRKGPTAGGEFTPGGSGLRNRAGGAGAEGGGRTGQGGMMGAPMGGAGNRNERERRDRADYLHEDEETWTNGTPQSNPGVIE